MNDPNDTPYTHDRSMCLVLSGKADEGYEYIQKVLSRGKSDGENKDLLRVVHDLSKRADHLLVCIVSISLSSHVSILFNREVHFSECTLVYAYHA